MKRLIICILSCVMILSLTACGEGSASGSAASAKNTSSPSQGVQNTTQAMTPSNAAQNTTRTATPSQAAQKATQTVTPSSGADTSVGTNGLQYEAQIGGYWVTGYNGISADIVIPDTWSDGQVVGIAEDAFKGIKIESVVLGQNVKQIDRQAFKSCSALSSVTLNEGLETIGTYAFENCKGLKEIMIPSSVTKIGGLAFWNCSNLEKILFDSGSELTVIYPSAFKGCTALSEINLQDTALKGVGDTAFVDCTSLKSLYFPASCTAFGQQVFSGWGSDKNIYFACAEDDLIVCSGTNAVIYDKSSFPFGEGKWDYQIGDIFTDCEANITWNYSR